MRFICGKKDVGSQWARFFVGVLFVKFRTHHTGLAYGRPSSYIHRHSSPPRMYASGSPLVPPPRMAHYALPAPISCLPPWHVSHPAVPTAVPPCPHPPCQSIHIPSQPTCRPGSGCANGPPLLHTSYWHVLTGTPSIQYFVPDVIRPDVKSVENKVL